MRAVRSNPLDVKFGLCVGLGTPHVKTNIQWKLGPEIATFKKCSLAINPLKIYSSCKSKFFWENCDSSYRSLTVYYVFHCKEII